VSQERLIINGLEVIGKITSNISKNLVLNFHSYKATFLFQF